MTTTTAGGGVAQQHPQRAGRREWMALGVLALATLLSAFDLFVMLLAIPRVSVDLGASGTQTLWTLDIYGFMVAGLLITMGGIGDRFGHRRLLLGGAALFGIASVVCAFAPTAAWLIAGRALLGVAGATLGPATLSLVMALFKDPKQVGIGIAVWAGAFQGGAIIGPIAGGVLLDHFWWGSVFLIGVPAMLVLLALGPFVLPEARNPDPAPLDAPSLVLSLGAILSLVYGVKSVPDGDRIGVTILALTAGVVLGALFLRRQKLLPQPLVDLTLFRNRTFRAVLAALAGFSMMTGATMVFNALYLQEVRGLSPLEAGFAMIPGLFLGIVSIGTAPLLAQRFRPALLMGVAAVVVASGLLFITTADGTSMVPIVVGYAIWCAGGGPIVGLGMQLIMTSAPPERSGMVSSLGQIANEMGYSLGVAVVGTVGTAVYASSLSSNAPAGTPPSILEIAQEGVARAVAVAGEAGVPGLAEAAQSSFVTSLGVVATASAVVVVALGALLLRAVWHVPPFGAQDGSEDDGATDAPGSLTESEATHTPQNAGSAV